MLCHIKAFGLKFVNFNLLHHHINLYFRSLINFKFHVLINRIIIIFVGFILFVIFDIFLQIFLWNIFLRIQLLWC